MKKFSETMKSVERKISDTNTSISNYEKLKKVHNVRDNLKKVIQFVEYFARVPDKEKELHRKLENEPAKLKEVFLESLMLDANRVALMKEIKHHESDLRDFVESHVTIVPRLAKDVANAAVDNLGIVGIDALEEKDFLDLALESPADLTMTFEVIEMHQEYYDRRKDQIFKRLKKIPIELLSEEREGEELSEIKLFSVYNVRERAKERIKQRIGFRMELVFDEEISKAAGLGDKQLEAVEVAAALDAASELVRIMYDIRNVVEPCAPPGDSWGLTYLYFQVFEEKVLPKIQKFHEKAEKLNVAGDSQSYRTE